MTARSMPHCDHRVLHPRGSCEFCDLPEYDDLHRIREMLGINHTGEGDSRKRPCPAEAARSIDTINLWSGNRPYPDPPAPPRPRLRSPRRVKPGETLGRACDRLVAEGLAESTPGALRSLVGAAARELLDGFRRAARVFGRG